MLSIIGAWLFNYSDKTESRIKAVPATAIKFVKEETLPSTLLFVGDVMLDRGIERIARKKNDWRYPFLKVTKLLSDSDLLFGNLESPISNRGRKAGSIYSFRADPYVLQGLIAAGFDVMSFANNHVWDYGREAFTDTLLFLNKVGIGYVGAGFDYKEAHKPLVKNIRGTKIAFLAYTKLIPVSLTRENSTPAVAYLELSQVKADIEKAAALADIVVVSYHWGQEYKTTHSSFQEKIARASIDAGATLVIGHHPHVVQGVEKYKNGYIAYSLGNFIFDQNFSRPTSKGLLLKTEIVGKSITNVQLIEVSFNQTFQPLVAGVTDFY